MRRRGCLIAAGSMMGLLLLCCVVAWFAGLPRLRDSLEGDLANSISTEISDQIDRADIGPGSYPISVADMQQQLAGTLTSQNVENFNISVDPNGMTIRFTSSGQTAGYSGVPIAENGQLIMENMEVDNGVLGFFMPADRLGSAIESGVNNYFDAQGLDVSGVELGNDVIIVEAVGE